MLLHSETELKTIKKRYYPLTAVLSLLAVCAASVLFLLFGGRYATETISYAANRYLDRMEYLDISFNSFSGSPLKGYEVRNLRVGTKTEPEIVTLGRFFIAPDIIRTRSAGKLFLTSRLESLKVEDAKLAVLSEAAAKEFPAGEAKKDVPSRPLRSLPVLPSELTAKSLHGTGGWQVDSLSTVLKNDRMTPESQPVYDVEVNAGYQKESAELSGDITLFSTGLPKAADLKLSALGSTLHFITELSGSRIDVKKVEGKLFGSPLKGSASYDTAQTGNNLSADLDLSNVDFKPLKRWVPDLDKGVLERLKIRLSGSPDRPKGEVLLRGGRVAYQGYVLNNLGGTVKLNGKRGRLSLSSRIFDGDLNASGTVDFTRNNSLNINASLALPHLDALGSALPGLKKSGIEGAFNATATIRGTASAPTVKIRAESKEVKLHNTAALSNIILEADATRKALDISRLSLEAFGGTISSHGRVGIAGKVPTLNLDGSVRNLDIARAAMSEEVSGLLNSSFKISGTLSNPGISADASVKSFDAGRFGAKDLSLSAKGNSKLKIEMKGTTKFNTPFGGGGTVTLPIGGRKSDIDLVFRMKRLNIAEFLPNTIKFAGNLATKISVKGTFDNPRAVADIESPEIDIDDFSIIRPHANLRYADNKAEFKASIAVGNARPEVRGTASFKKGLICNLEAIADDVEITAIEPSLKGVVDGKLKLRAHGSINGNRIDLKGDLTSPQITASGIPFTRLSIPFSFKNNKLAIKKGCVNTAGSTVHLKVDGDVNTGIYHAYVNGEKLDLTKLAAGQAIPAELSGLVDFSFKGRARTGLATLVSGDGNIALKDFRLDHYPGQTVVSGKAPIRINHGKVFFNVNDGELYIMPGSTLTAPIDDTLYHYIAFSGTAWHRPRSFSKAAETSAPADLVRRAADMYNMNITGRVNVRALNSVLGGLGASLKAIATGGNITAEDFASDVIQKMIGGGLATQFRDFVLDIAGKDYSEFRILKLKFDGEGTYKDVGNTDWTESAPDKADSNLYKFHYSLPVGPK